MTLSEQFKARGLSGRYVIMGLTRDGDPCPGLAAHGLGCHVPDRPGEEPFGPVPVEEVPEDTKPCGFCGGGALPRWRAER